MFEDPHMIYEIARQKHKELLAEAECIHKLKSSSNIVKKKNRRLGKMMLPIADLFIAVGIALRRRCGAVPEGTEGNVSDGSKS